jgi:CheY-like chemotaxis protein
MSGHELASRIRERPELNSICLVALTGYGQTSDRELAFAAGFDRHLTKPVDVRRMKDLFDGLDKPKHKSEPSEAPAADTHC